MKVIERNHKHSMAGVPFFGGNMLTGQQLKDEGIKLVLSRNERWSEHILHVLETFCAIKKEEGSPQFVLEEFRRHCKSLGISEPRHHNAWGAVAKVSADKGLIMWSGEYCKAKSPAAHARTIKVWIAI
ncbi:hypothetical protein NB644_09615 [Oxalobacter formigenes]|uniref:hypothetical protein n=1 Tax=Oxalobacter formigenes TaxID=847 RepID=UPI0022AEED03|nr:hypothetical protein [Oxalobacter formigenes]WAW01192.1 hypothetical protein NB644_09615 [Oxalobacter formigenes]WAW03520.1 hypothetical protein NB642_10385 [Oxalobacter formigenes]